MTAGCGMFMTRIERDTQPTAMFARVSDGTAIRSKESTMIAWNTKPVRRLLVIFTRENYNMA